jgi:hypothetical protein
MRAPENTPVQKTEVFTCSAPAMQGKSHTGLSLIRHRPEKNLPPAVRCGHECLLIPTKQGDARPGNGLPRFIHRNISFTPQYSTILGRGFYSFNFHELLLKIFNLIFLFS